jgi:riboflavin synthase
MFTGLVQSLGNLRPLTEDKMEISCIGAQATAILTDLVVGDSVAVDGACLTVETVLKDGFIAAVSPETLQRTSLGGGRGVRVVNLETSLRVGGKIGGHFVTGHIDVVGILVGVKMVKNSWEMRFSTPPNLINQWQRYISPYLVSKGSITVNGVSLTVADCDSSGEWFTVSVIPHTYQETNLSLLKVNDLVNLEADILAKYVQRSILGNHDHPDDQTISLDFLTYHGYQ